MTALRRCCFESLDWKGPKAPTKGAQHECRWCYETLVYDGSQWHALNVRSAANEADLLEQRLARYAEILGHPLPADASTPPNLKTCESCGGIATLMDWTPTTATYVCADAHVSFATL